MSEIPDIRRGRDSFGTWSLVSAHCTNCDRVVVCIKYDPTAKFQFKVAYVKGKFTNVDTEKVDLSKTILKRHRNPIGLQCGCYAKFHRQMAHISDKRRSRGK